MNIWPRRVLRLGGAFFVLAVAAFCLNGLVLAHRNTPVLHAGSAVPTDPEGGPELRIVTWNIAKAFVHRGDVRFVSTDTARTRLESMGDVLREIDADVVLLQEVLLECGPCPVNQMTAIANAAGYPYRVYGEHANLGIPGFRISTGNALLSRYPISDPEVIDLPGRKPFWVTNNSRRALYATLTPPDAMPFRVANLHLDSRNATNRLAQAEDCHRSLPGPPWIIGGDFNDLPDSPVWSALAKETGIRCPTGQATYPQWKPEVEIDGFVVSDSWEVISTHRVSATGSDHYPVVISLRRAAR